MSVACPKCASPDALSLSLIHREGAAAHADSSGAAPPSKRNEFGWLLVSLGCGALFVLSIRQFGAFTILYAGGALIGLSLARSNRAFNATRFPELYNQWQLSFRCSRCGAVFLAL